jgi:hypothetical protein
MRIEPEISAAAIVMIGHFNPQIFQPFWLAHHDIISEEEAESANIGFVNPEITRFILEGEFSIQVERESDFQSIEASRRSFESRTLLAGYSEICSLILRSPKWVSID